MSGKKRIIIAITGASGAPFGIRLLEVLKPVPQIETHLVLSGAGKLNIKLETDWTVAAVEALADEVHDVRNIAAPISSGSFKTDGMIIAPCSMKTLAGVVHSYGDNLVTRAADVVLKERRRLTLLVREAPLHTGHCKLLLEASSLGAIIFPPVPAFYNRPATLEDIVDHTVGRVLDLYDIDPGIVKRWNGPGRTPGHVDAD